MRRPRCNCACDLEIWQGDTGIAHSLPHSLLDERAVLDGDRRRWSGSRLSVPDREEKRTDARGSLVWGRAFSVGQHDGPDLFLLALRQVWLEKIGQVYLGREYTNV